MATHNEEHQLDAMKRQGRLLIQKRRIKEAKTLLTDLCGLSAADAEAWYLLSSVNGMLGDIEAAGECCRRAIDMQPDFCEAHVNLGHVYLSQGRHEDALGQYQAAVKLNPQHAAALSGFGNVLTTLGKHEEAVKAYQGAVRINPNQPEAYYNLGNLKKAQKQYEEAVHYYQQAIRLNPNYAAAYNNLGAVLYAHGHPVRGVEHIRRALEIDPDLPAAYFDLGFILYNEGSLTEAGEALEMAVKLNPDFPRAHYTLATVRYRQGRPEAALEISRHVLRLQPHRADVHSCLVMTMHYLPEYSSTELLEAARGWCAQHSPAQSSVPPLANDADPRRRLRVGYVSADLRNHPVGYFIQAVLAHHDRSRFEVYCYSNSEESDDLTHRIQGYSDHWRDISGQSDEAVDEQIRQDAIDILIDLSGHTAENRLPVFARKPAPVQATWLGYFATTGLAAMDYIIADRFVIPPEQERYYIEQVVRLPEGYLCFTPPDYAIDTSPPPALTEGRITFGCFQNIAKLSSSVKCWSRILHAVPDSRLYFRNKSFGDKGVQAWCTAQFAEHGIAAERIAMRGYAPRDELLAAYGEVDIALDPFPYNGGTTTVEALWMGVPVVSMRGDRFVSRVGDSILSAVGLEELVVDTEDAYVAEAVELATDLPRLARLRAGLRDRLLHSPLCDGPGFTHGLEVVYRAMWEAWCHKSKA